MDTTNDGRARIGSGMTEPQEEPRPDAALGLSGIPHTGEAITADGHLVEPQAGDFRHARSAPKDLA